MAALHISISAETVGHLGPLVVSNSIVLSVICSIVLLLLAGTIRSGIVTKGKPGRLQMVGELLVEGFLNLIESIVGKGAKVRLFFPLLTTFFLFILVNNWFGLLPGVGTIGFYETPKHAEAPASYLAAAETAKESAPVTDVVEQQTEHADTTEKKEAKEEKKVFVPYLRAGTADLNTTLALALISVVMTQVWGVKFLHLEYFSKFMNFSNPGAFVLGILELILEIAKIMSFAFRLFGNIFAGEVLLVVMTFLVPLVVPMPFYGLELFVGVIQALVFTLLSLVFFNLATVSHHEEQEHAHAS